MSECACLPGEVDYGCPSHGCDCSSVAAHLIDTMTAHACRFNKRVDELSASKGLDEYGYPPDWPKCPGCGLPALDGHITCGKVECDEGGRR